MAHQVFHNRRIAAGHSSVGRIRLLNRRPGRALHLERCQTWVSLAVAHPLGVPLSRYRLGSIEREREVCLGYGRPRGAAWLPTDEYRQHAPEILQDVADGHSKAGPELCLVPDRLPVSSPVHFLDHVSAVTAVLRGKANDCGPRNMGAGVWKRILHRGGRQAASRQPVVPVFLRSIQPLLVCLVVYPAGLLGVEFLLPCLVGQWFLAGSCVPVDVRAAYLHPFPAGWLRSRLACPRTGADLSTPFSRGHGPLQSLEPGPAWE